MRLHIWMNFPSHHQAGFFDALIDAGVDLKVTYYSAVSDDRKRLGWSVGQAPRAWENFIEGSVDSALATLSKFADHIHVIPGYGAPLLRALTGAASSQGIRWCHWSEAASPGLRWLVSLPRKRRYARTVNQHALGAFAQGDMARRDFMRWGIDARKIAHLFYAVPELPSMAPHPDIVSFAAGRLTFLFLGRLDHGKAVDVQIEAFLRLQAVDACLVCIGSGDHEPLTRRVSSAGAGDRIRFFAPVATRDVGSTLQCADVLLLPSRYDGWGVVANEAASASKALILSSACGSAWHLVEPGINGFMVKPGCVASLQAAMHNYIQGGRSLADRHGKESRRISESFSCQASARRLIQAIDSWTAGSWSNSA